MEWPKVQVTVSKTHTEYKFIRCSWLMMITALSLLVAVSVPYVIVLARGTMNPFLPLISDIGGSPPQSGIFNLLLIASSFWEFLTIYILHIGIGIQMRRLEDEYVRQTTTVLNQICFVSGHVTILGNLIIGSFPMDFYKHTEEWIYVTLIPHVVGAVLAIVGMLAYCIISTYLMSLLNPTRKQLTGFRIFLVSLIMLFLAVLNSTVLHGYLSHLEDSLHSCVMEPNNTPFSLFYLISSVSQWLLAIVFIVFLMTLKEDMKAFSFSLTVSLQEENTRINREEPEPTENVEHSNNNPEGTNSSPDISKKKF